MDDMEIEVEGSETNESKRDAPPTLKFKPIDVENLSVSLNFIYIIKSCNINKLFYRAKILNFEKLLFRPIVMVR